jgi:hypothetical protein
MSQIPKFTADLVEINRVEVYPSMMLAGAARPSVLVVGWKYSWCLMTDENGDGLYLEHPNFQLFHARDFSLVKYLPLDTAAKKASAREYIKRKLVHLANDAESRKPVPDGIRRLLEAVEAGEFTLPFPGPRRK